MSMYLTPGLAGTEDPRIVYSVWAVDGRPGRARETEDAFFARRWPWQWRITSSRASTGLRVRCDGRLAVPRRRY